MCDFSLEIVESGRHWDGMTQTLKEGRNNSLSNNAMPSKVILGKKKKRTVRKLLTENIYSNPIVLEEMLISLVN